MAGYIADFLHVSGILQPKLGPVPFRACTIKLIDNGIVAKLYLLVYNGALRNITISHATLLIF